MAERETTQSRPAKKSGRSRRRFWRWTIVVLLGLMLGLGVVWFLRTVYNPFARGVPSPLVLVPEDCDFVVSIPDLPALAAGIRDRRFVEAVSKHEGFAEFLQTPFVREVGVVEVVREAILQLNLARGTLPLGLDLVGDVSGTHVVLAGYVPKAASSTAEKQPYRFMAVIRPGSWLTVAGVNILLDQTLYGWFLRSEVEKDGTEVEHYRDSVRIRPRRLGRDLFVTRLADTILVSTEGQQLSRIHNAVTLSGLPIAPHARYQRLVPEFQTRVADAVVLARRGAVDQELRVERTLRELWGAETLDLAESSFPRLGGEDVLAFLHLDDVLSLTLAGDRGRDRARDFGPLLQPFGAERLRASLADVARLFPKEGFGVVYFEAALGQLVRVALERGLLAKAFAEELDVWLGKTAAFQSRQGFYGFFDTVAKDRIALVCFRQPRETYVDKAEPGIAIVAPLDNEAKLRAALAEIEGQVRRMEAKVVTDLVRRKAGTVEIFEPMLAGSAVDDYRVTKPAIAIVDGMVILTNFAPVLDLIPDALARREASLAAHAGLEEAVAAAPQDLRVALLGDLSAIYPYLEQSIQGWTTSRTRVTTLDYVRWNAEFAETTRAKQLKPGTPDWESAQIEFVSRKKEAHESIVRPRVLRDYESHLRYFRDLFSSLSIFVEESAGSLAFSLRLSAQ